MKNLILVLQLTLGLSLTMAAQFTLHSSSHLTLSGGSVLTVVGLDVEIRSGGMLTNQGTLYTNQSFFTDGTLTTEISGSTPGTDYGRVTADIGAALGGTLTVTKDAAYNPTGLVSHPVVLTGSRTGTFSIENLPGTTWLVDYSLSAADVVFDLGLPVSWLSFSAEARDKSVILDWATAAEQSNDYFAVERKLPTDDQWVEIGQITTSGNGQRTNYYSLTDQSPPEASDILYRIRQVDFDGTYSFSPIRTVSFTSLSRGVLAYPNPTAGAVTLTVDKSTGDELALYDRTGQLLLKQPLNHDDEGHRFVFPAELPSGIYLLRVGDRTERVFLRR